MMVFVGINKLEEVLLFKVRVNMEIASVSDSNRFFVHDLLTFSFSLLLSFLSFPMQNA
jgi:hypothetical protein